jgi:hypothetical protein
MSNDFSGMLNRSTPFAPTSEEEISKRLETSNDTQRERTPLPQSQAAPEIEEARHLHDEIEAHKLDVFVPVREMPHRNDGPVLVQYEVREFGEGQGAVAIYTTPEGLYEALGQFQPMVKVDVIEFLRQIQGRVPVLVNPILQEGIARRRGEELD